MNLFRELVTDNPMMVELYRRTRRFTLSKDNRQNVWIGIVLIAVVFVLAALFFAQAGSVTPWGMASIKLPLLCLALPLALHGAIAGERDRRSWDALCIAPVTDAQIVAGKFAVAIALMFIVHLIFLPIELAAVLTEDGRDRLADFLIAARLDAYTMAMGFFVASVSFLASARSRRPFPALGAAGGVFAALLAISIVTVVSGDAATMGKRWFQPVVAITNPVVHYVVMFDDGKSSSAEDISAHIKAAPEIGGALYALIGVGLLVFAARTLHDADQEIVPVPRKKTAPHA